MKILKIILLTAIIALAAGIFILSAQPKKDSNALSKEFTIKIVEIYQKITGNVDETQVLEIVNDIHGLTRKYAHFILYTLLGVLTGLFFAVVVYGRYNISPWLYAWLFCIAYAISDEFHQTFVSGRSGELRDVLIDTAGALLGITAVIVVGRCISKKKRV